MTTPFAPFIITAALAWAAIIPATAQASKVYLHGGPRAGVTATSVSSSPLVMSQLGAELETRWDTGTSTQVTLGVDMLIGGVDQGLVLPSLAGLAGFRIGSGFELGLGPNINLDLARKNNAVAQIGLMFTAGQAFALGDAEVPVNISVTPSAQGTSVTLLCGFDFVIQKLGW